MEFRFRHRRPLCLPLPGIGAYLVRFVQKILAHASRVKLVDDAGVLRLWQIQHYLEDLARHTMQNTRRGGRVEANLADVLQAFQEMVRR